MPLYRCASRKAPATRRGLTLLELIVALGILAVLSTIAITSLDPLADQARYEATRRLLDDLRRATVGDDSLRQLDGQPMVRGYLADTGTLPAGVADFLTQPPGIITHSIQTFDSDRDGTDDVTLSSGWRGPYVHLGAGQTELVDGWGRSVLVDPDGGVFDFTSLGGDNDSVAPEESYAADLTVTIEPTEYASNVVFRLFAIDSSTGVRIDPSLTAQQQLGVLLYCVNGNGGTTGAIQEVLIPVSASGSFEVTRTNMIHGIAAARGILWRDPDGDDLLESHETILLTSYVHYFTATSGADTRIEMELR